MAAATATAVALYEHVCSTCGLFFSPSSSSSARVHALCFSSLVGFLHCYYSCDRSAAAAGVAATNSEVRPGQILGSEIAIGQAHASGQKKNLEGTVHRGSWEQPWLHLPGRDESSKSSHGAGMAAGGRWQALFVEGGGGDAPLECGGSNISMREGLVAFLFVKLYVRSSNNSCEQ